jgi:hypothetical protein
MGLQRVSDQVMPLLGVPLYKPAFTLPALDCSKHRVIVSGRFRDGLKHVPMLDYLAFIINTEDVDARPVVVARPLLVAMQDYIIAFSEDALKLDALARIFFRHPLEIFDESLLPVGHCWVVLDVQVADIFPDGFCGLTLIEHQVIKCRDRLFVLLKFIRHPFHTSHYPKRPTAQISGGKETRTQH